MASKSAKSGRHNGQRAVEYYDDGGNKKATHVGGEPAWRNNNPGNLKWSPFTRDKLGAIGTDGTFAIFPSWEAGEEAKRNLMKLSGRYKGKTIAEAMEIYAPRSENNTDAYLKFIKQKSGVDLSRKVDGLTPEEYEKFMGAIREYESSAGRGSEKGKGTVIEHGGKDAQATPAADLSTLRPEPRPQMGGQEAPATTDGEAKAADRPAEPESQEEQKGSEAPTDPRAASLVQMASAPIADAGRAAVLKPVETLTEPEMKDMIDTAQSGFRGWRSGDPLKSYLYEKVQDWHVNVYGDGPQADDGGKPIEPTPIRPVTEQPSPHTTPQGEDLWQATGRIGQKVADAGAQDGFDDAVKGLQRGLNILNQANPLPQRSPAYAPYTKLGPVDEDGKYGPQTDFALKQVTARLGAPKVEEAFALGRFNTFARNAQRNGTPEGLEGKTHSIFGPLFRNPADSKAPKIEGGVLQETLNDFGPKHHDDWEPLKVDNWIGPKTTDAFGKVLKAEDADTITGMFGRGLGLL